LNKFKFLALITTLTMFSCYTINTNKSNNSLINKVANANMSAFPWQEEDWEEKDYSIFLKNSTQKRIHPEPRRKRMNAFEFFKKVEQKKTPSDESVFTGNMTWDDLNLFCGDSDRKLYIGNVIDLTCFELGTVSLLKTLATPTADIKVLKKRQSIIRFFLENPELQDELRILFSESVQAENVMLSFWRIDNFKHASRKTYFEIPGFRWLNKYRHALLLKSMFHHQIRIGHVVSGTVTAGTLLTYSLLKALHVNCSDKIENWAQSYKRGPGKIFMSFFSFFKPLDNFIERCKQYTPIAVATSAGIGLTSALGIPGSTKWAYECFVIEDCIQNLMIEIAQFVHTLEKVYEVIRLNKELATHHEFKDLILLFEEKIPESEELQEFFSLMHHNTFKGTSSVFSHKGNVLRSFALLHMIKKDLEDALIALGSLDKWLAMAELFKQKQGTNNPLCFAEYKQSEAPFIQLKDFWHPLIKANNVIHNSITLGVDNKKRNIIVTGPNAGGKSTSLKAIAINILLAQTFGISPSATMCFTPFSLIATYLNITDDIGAGSSLFKAEVERTDKLLNAIESLEPKQKSFVIFDEIFNGTSPLEGMASAYSVAQHLAKLPNSICLLATHFKELTKLEETTDTFNNYKVSVQYNDDGTIHYPYKLESGISKQHVAIDILRNEGFDSRILDTAQAIVAQHS